MQTSLIESLRTTAQGQHADAILRSCVHCGFCNATCPTYQLLGDELDGPRGRIYQIKQMLEGQPPDKNTQVHLDRCLTCRNCETTCPSGVRYSELLDIGREHLEKLQPRPFWQIVMRRMVLYWIQQRWLFGFTLSTGRLLRPLLPQKLQRSIPIVQTPISVTQASHRRKMLLLPGCAQPLLSPNINRATAQVLDRLGIEVIERNGAGCCGAASHHTSAHQQAKQFARRMIDDWWPLLSDGVEAIVMTASGCGVHVKHYGALLADDPEYADKAKRVSSMTYDLIEIIARENVSRLVIKNNKRPLSVHTPCTLQHGQKLSGHFEALLRQLGYTLLPVAESHLCCGSAGTYSLLQPVLSKQLRTRKLDNLLRPSPQMIVTANVGCLHHLAAGTDIPVSHWIEIIANDITSP